MVFSRCSFVISSFFSLLLFTSVLSKCTCFVFNRVYVKPLTDFCSVCHNPVYELKRFVFYFPLLICSVCFLICWLVKQKRTKYFITQFVSNCLGFFYCLSENYKHHRLKHNMNGSAKNATNFTDFVQNSNYHHSRHKRSPGVSREHTVETLVVADSAMFQYHGSDLQQYVLTLMSIVSTSSSSPLIFITLFLGAVVKKRR